MKALKTILLLVLFSALHSNCFSQQKELPIGWHLMDKTTAGYYGISYDKALEFVTQKKLKSKRKIKTSINN